MNIYGGNELDPVFPREKLSSGSGCPPPYCPLAPDSQTRGPGTKSSSPVTSLPGPRPGVDGV